jgi:hypothetical protein
VTAAETSVTVASCDLRRVLRDTLPFSGREAPLDVVCLEAVAGTFSATATDRYTLGHARTACRGEFGRPVVISRKDAARIKRVLPCGPVPHRAGDETTLTVGTDGLYVRVSAGSPGELGFLAATAEIESEVTFPDYAVIVPKVTGDPASEPFGLSPSLLARFAKIADRAGYPLRFHVHDPLSRILVEVGDDFTGVIMPVKIPDKPAEPTVPLGHPAPAPSVVVDDAVQAVTA